MISAQDEPLCEPVEGSADDGAAPMEGEAARQGGPACRVLQLPAVRHHLEAQPALRPPQVL